MNIGVLTVTMRLHGCRSLKEKRQRIAGLRDRFGKSSNLAVCESGMQNSKLDAEISFICAASARAPVEGSLSKVLDFCHQHIDAEIVHDTLTWL